MDSSAPTIPRPNVLRLPETIMVDELASACRDAWRVFMEQSQDWSTAELVLWCHGFYAPTVRHASGPYMTRELTADDDFSRIDSRFVERMIMTARAKMTEMLWSFSLPRARFEFACTMRERGAVTSCQDTRGVHAFMPTPAADALVDRVLSLLAADLMTRPNDFEGETMCSHCGSIAIGASACCAHTSRAQKSGIVTAPTVTIMPGADEAKTAVNG